ncbi:MAG: hypothetical protein IIC00_04275 [Planctomycetes bacterium]|nr:hypothetical protein [Planctomycetota bacterium]
MRTKVAMATTAIATISSIEPTAPFLRFAKQNGWGKHVLVKTGMRVA